MESRGDEVPEQVAILLSHSLLLFLFLVSKLLGFEEQRGSPLPPKTPPDRFPLLSPLGDMDPPGQPWASVLSPCSRSRSPLILLLEPLRAFDRVIRDSSVSDPGWVWGRQPDKGQRRPSCPPPHTISPGGQASLWLLSLNCEDGCFLPAFDLPSRGSLGSGHSSALAFA